MVCEGGRLWQQHKEAQVTFTCVVDVRRTKHSGLKVTYKAQWSARIFEVAKLQLSGQPKFLYEIYVYYAFVIFVVL